MSTLRRLQPEKSLLQHLSFLVSCWGRSKPLHPAQTVPPLQILAQDSLFLTIHTKTQSRPQKTFPWLSSSSGLGEPTDGNLKPVLVNLVNWSGFYYVWTSLFWGQRFSCQEEISVGIRWQNKSASDTDLARKPTVISSSLLNLGSVFTNANTTLPQGQQPPCCFKRFCPPLCGSCCTICSGLCSAPLCAAAALI